MGKSTDNLQIHINMQQKKCLFKGCQANRGVKAEVGDILPRNQINQDWSLAFITWFMLYYFLHSLETGYYKYNQCFQDLKVKEKEWGCEKITFRTSSLIGMLNAQYTASNKYTVISKKYRHIIMDKKNFKNEVLSNVNCSICIFFSRHG